jgi:hypothetical protein
MKSNGNITIKTHKDYIKAAKFASNHRQSLVNDKVCGCYYCLEIFSPSEIVEWSSESDDEIDVTATCPHCSIDSVISESSGYPITKEFLKEMQKFAFGDIIDTIKSE